MYLAATHFFTSSTLFLDGKNSLVNVIGQSQTAEVSLAAKYTLSPHYGQSLLNDCARLRNVDRAMQLRFAASVVEIRRCFHRA